MNSIHLIGNLTRDPEVKFTASGKAITGFSLAVNKSYKDANGNKHEKTCFIDVEIWDKSGEAFAKFHKKGDPAIIEGELAQDTWDDKTTGQKRSKHKVTCNQWTFVPGKREGAPSAGPGANERRETHQPHVDDSEVPF